MEETNYPSKYADKQAAREAAYKDEFQKWNEAMTPEERKEAERLGVSNPHIDPQGVGAPELDTDRIADFTYMPNFDFDSPEEEFNVAKTVERLSLERLNHALVEIMDSRNARLTVECLAFVSGIAFLGDSETEIAKKYGISRAAVSKRCVELTKKLNLLPSRGMKSEAAREAYRESRNAVYDESIAGASSVEDYDREEIERKQEKD